MFIAVAAGLIGFAHLLLGMRENQILNVVIFLVVLLPLSFVREAIHGHTVSWLVVGVLLMVALLLLVLIGCATRYLSKERIVTTIP